MVLKLQTILKSNRPAVSISSLHHFLNVDDQRFAQTTYQNTNESIRYHITEAKVLFRCQRQKTITQLGFLLEYFKRNPGIEIPHSEIIDFVVP